MKRALLLVGGAVLSIAAIAAVRAGRTHERPQADPDPNRCLQSSHRCPDCNVLFISIDTLRADHLHTYGYERETSPRIDALAADGLTFENARSHSPSTLQSHTTMFTSLHAGTHRAGVLAPASPSLLTLAEILSVRGYDTAAFVSGQQLSPSMGLNQGFQTYDDSQMYNLAEGVNRLAIPWVTSFRWNPFFLFVHYIDPHHPYDPPPPYDSAFGDPYLDTVSPVAVMNGLPYEDATRIIHETFDSDINVSDRDREHVVDLYDGEIKYTDKEVGRLLDALDASGASKHTIVILTSDHGEEFGDHGAALHAHSLHSELLHVPLIIKVPDVPPMRIATRVRLVDLMPTVLDLLGISLEEDMEGASVMCLVDTPGKDRDALGQIMGDDAKKIFATSLEAGPYKLIAWVNSSEELFQTRLDPTEQHDLATSSVALTTMLHEEIARPPRLRPRTPEAANADEETLKQLRALGYL